MSEANVDVIRQVEAAFNRGDLDTMLDLFAPAGGWEISESNPSARTLHGRDEIRAAGVPV